MTESHDQFFPDDVDEQIEQLVLHRSLSSPDIQLICDLYAFYEEDARIVYRVWIRLLKRHLQNSTSLLPPLPPP
jgi:hypothetical protein